MSMLIFSDPGEKPFSCLECGRHFGSKNAVRRHEKLHSGKKSYKCGVCAQHGTDYATVQRANMKVTVWKCKVQGILHNWFIKN